MKKTLIYILLAIITLTQTSALSANADALKSTQHLIAAETQEIPKPDAYQQPIIPKPTFLPGPSENQQEDYRANNDPSKVGGLRLFVIQILPRIAIMMIGFVGSLSLVFLLISGFRFATNYGNDEAIDSAKKQAMFSVIGFMLALLSYTIVAILTNIEFVNDNTERTGNESKEQPAPRNNDNNPDKVDYF